MTVSISRGLRRAWSIQDDAYLRAHCASATNAAMACALGRSAAAVASRASVLHLRADPASREPAWRFSSICQWERGLRAPAPFGSSHACARV